MEAQYAVDVVGEVLVDQVVARNVHAHSEPVTGAVKAGCLRHGDIEDGTSELWHHPVLLGQWDEAVGVEQPEGGMWPADEGFDAADRAGVHFQCGLVVQYEGPGADGVSQGVDEGEAFAAIGISFGSVGRHSRLRSLGVVHGDIGAAQELPVGFGISAR